MPLAGEPRQHTEQNSSGSPAEVNFTVDSKVLISGSFKTNWNGETEEGTFEYVRDGRKMSLEIKLVEGQRQVLLIDGHQSTVLFSPDGERFTVSDIGESPNSFSEFGFLTAMPNYGARWYGFVDCIDPSVIANDAFIMATRDSTPTNANPFEDTSNSCGSNYKWTVEGENKALLIRRFDCTGKDIHSKSVAKLIFNRDQLRSIQVRGVGDKSRRLITTEVSAEGSKVRKTVEIDSNPVAEFEFHRTVEVPVGDLSSKFNGGRFGYQVHSWHIPSIAIVAVAAFLVYPLWYRFTKRVFQGGAVRK